jgi:hypothetical protein
MRNLLGGNVPREKGEPNLLGVGRSRNKTTPPDAKRPVGVISLITAVSGDSIPLCHETIGRKKTVRKVKPPRLAGQSCA